MHRALRKLEIALIRFHSGPALCRVSDDAPAGPTSRAGQLRRRAGCDGCSGHTGPTESWTPSRMWPGEGPGDPDRVTRMTRARPGRGPYWSWPALVPVGRPDPIWVTRMLWSFGERRDHPKRPGPEQSRKMHTRHLLLRHALAA